MPTYPRPTETAPDTELGGAAPDGRLPVALPGCRGALLGLIAAMLIGLVLLAFGWRVLAHWLQPVVLVCVVAGALGATLAERRARAQRTEP